MEEAFALYHRAQKMMELGSAFSRSYTFPLPHVGMGADKQ